MHGTKYCAYTVHACMFSYRISIYVVLYFQNPLPGLHVLQPQVSYSRVDDDYHLCPLPRYKLTNKSGTNRPDKPFIERPVSPWQISVYIQSFSAVIQSSVHPQIY